MELYRSRFSEQIEAVSAEEVLSNWSGRSTGGTTGCSNEAARSLGCGLGFMLPMVGATRSDLLPHSSCRIRSLMGLALMLTSENNRVVDVAIVGGGPAGLTASLYLARFLRSVVVLDAGDARAALIPMSRNCPGFPEGIGGGEMLRRLKHQAAEHGAEIVHATVETIEVRDGAFALYTASGTVEALFVILATGIVDKVPAIVGLREGISAGSIGLCPVCDGYEATGKKIGVVGQEEDALKEALFLRTYSSHVFMVANSPGDVGAAVRKQAADAGIEIWDTVADVTMDATGLGVAMGDGSARQLDMLYPAMGCDVRSDLAANIGADCDDKGFILVNAHQETSVPRLYAIGDVVQALNQMAVGFGHAALAAAHIHNTMRKRSPPVRSGIPA